HGHRRRTPACRWQGNLRGQRPARGVVPARGRLTRSRSMSKRRVVITGAGIVSCIGNDLQTVESALREGRSGIKAVPKFTELGLRSQVAGVPEIDIEARIDRKQLRFMGDAAAYSQIALEDAIAQSGLTRSEERRVGKEARCRWRL